MWVFKKKIILNMHLNGWNKVRSIRSFFFFFSKRFEGKISVKYRTRSVEESWRNFVPRIPPANSNSERYREDINKKGSRIRMHRLSGRNSGRNWGRYLNDGEGRFSKEGGKPRQRRSSKAAALLRVIGSLAPISAELYSVVVVWEGGRVRRRAPWRPASLHPMVQSIYTWYIGWPAWRINPTPSSKVVFLRHFVIRVLNTNTTKLY